MINYEYLFRLKYRNSILIWICFLIVIIIIVLSFFLETYNSYHTMAVYHNNLIVSVPLNNSDALIEGDYLKIDNKKYNYEIKSISRIQMTNYQNYQDYEIKVDKVFENNEVIEMTFYYNKEKIIRKIFKIIF